MASSAPSGLPGDRLPKLKHLIKTLGRPVRIIETHSGLSGLIAEQATAKNKDGELAGFDAMWSSSLTASVLKGKPDIETVDTTDRLSVVKDTLAVTTIPMIYDADTGGKSAIFKFTVQQLEMLGVSGCIIEDKTGLKQNSLFGTDRVQVLEDIDVFCEKIQAGRAARRSEDFMVVARIEALIAGAGLEEALKRAAAYTEAGADGIMIHSRNKDPAEIFAFIKQYREGHGDNAKPIIVVPSSYNSVYESELQAAGVSVIIYANHLLRASYPAMLEVAETILANSRSLEVDSKVMKLKEVLTIIDEDPAAPKSLSSAAKRAAELPPAPDENADGKKSKKARGGAPAAPTPTKVDPAGLLAFLRNELKITFFVGVPDSCIAPFCAEVDKPLPAGSAPSPHVITANEGSSIGMALGWHLSTGAVPVVYMQNSGLGNAVNPLMSAAHPEVYGCPMILLIGWRGQPGKKDEPQHVVQGRQTTVMLASMEIEALTLPMSNEGARDVFNEAYSKATAGSRPVAILAPPGTFAGTKKVAVEDATATKPTREKAIRTVVENVKPGDAIVATTGYTSRELYEMREALGHTHEKDFLCVGSMGHAIAIAQGIALAQPERTVWCMDGDGAALMHLGNMAISGSMGLNNLRHVLLNNSIHDSVGGQPTAASQLAAGGGEAGSLDFSAIATASGYASVVTVETADDLAAALQADPTGNGAQFIECKLALGTRKDLGRPKTSTADAKGNFMGHLRS